MPSLTKNTTAKHRKTANKRSGVDSRFNGENGTANAAFRLPGNPENTRFSEVSHVTNGILTPVVNDNAPLWDALIDQLRSSGLTNGRIIRELKRCYPDQYEATQAHRKQTIDGARKRGNHVSDDFKDMLKFMSVLGAKPGPGYEIDRTIHDGPYSLDNCRWATKTDNLRNRRSEKPLINIFMEKNNCSRTTAYRIKRDNPELFYEDVGMRKLNPEGIKGWIQVQDFYTLFLGLMTEFWPEVHFHSKKLPFRYGPRLRQVLEEVGQDTYKSVLGFILANWEMVRDRMEQDYRRTLGEVPSISALIHEADMLVEVAFRLRKRHEFSWGIPIKFPGCLDEVTELLTKEAPPPVKDETLDDYYRRIAEEEANESEEDRRRRVLASLEASERARLRKEQEEYPIRSRFDLLEANKANIRALFDARRDALRDYCERVQITYCPFLLSPLSERHPLIEAMPEHQAYLVELERIGVTEEEDYIFLDSQGDWYRFQFMYEHKLAYEQKLAGGKTAQEAPNHVRNIPYNIPPVFSTLNSDDYENWAD